MSPHFTPFLTLSFSPSLSLRQRHLSTPWHRTPNVGDADVKRHRYLTVTHSAPLYPHHHNCNTSKSVSLSIFYPLQENVGGHLRQRMKNENWGSENTNTYLTPSLRPYGAAGKVARIKYRYILYGVYLNFKRAYNFSSMNSGWKLFSALNQHWGMYIWKQCWRNITATSQLTRPC